MKIKTQSTVTLTMSGAEAQKVAEFLYTNGASRESGPVLELWDKLSELPEEVE